jgi:hypothetical protein
MIANDRSAIVAVDGKDIFAPDVAEVVAIGVVDPIARTLSGTPTFV